MLHALVLSLAIWFAFWTIVLLPLYPHRELRLFLAILQEVGPVAVLIILRFGSLRWASLTYLAGALTFSTVGAVLSGGVHSGLLKYELMLPILATWLLGYRGAIWTTVACLSTMLVITVLQMLGVNFGPAVTTPLGAWVTQIQVILVGVVPVAQILERLKRESAERERHQQALRESEERFRDMANTAPVMIVIRDANGQVTFVNKTGLDFIGRAIEDELGSGWTTGVHPDDRNECLAKLSASREARVGFEMEYRLRCADGQYRSVMCRGVPRFEPDGALAGYVSSLIDITDLKQALAGQKLESLGVLASGIAHDFNNLLSGILACSELLLSDVDEASQARIELEKIKAIAIRASEIVRQLMVYAGEESAVSENIDLAELVREMLQLMMISITKNAALQIDVTENVPLIRANKAQMRQVVMNLITNASDALRDKGGTISVSLQHVRRQPESDPERRAESP